MADQKRRSQSAMALEAVLAENGEAAEKIRKKFHRTMLWRYCTDRGAPSADARTFLREASGGRIDSDSWPKAKPRPSQRGISRSKPKRTKRSPKRGRAGRHGAER